MGKIPGGKGRRSIMDYNTLRVNNNPGVQIMLKKGRRKRRS